MYRWRWDTAECFSMTLHLLFSFYNDLMIPTRHFPCFCTADLEKLLLYSVLVLHSKPPAITCVMKF
jgi:hypothetical protein